MFDVLKSFSQIWKSFNHAKNNLIRVSYKSRRVLNESWGVDIKLFLGEGEVLVPQNWVNNVKNLVN